MFGQEGAQLGRERIPTGELRQLLRAWRRGRAQSTRELRGRGRDLRQAAEAGVDVDQFVDRALDQLQGLARMRLLHDQFVEVREVVHDLVWAGDRVEMDGPSPLRSLPGRIPCRGKLRRRQTIDLDGRDRGIQLTELRDGTLPVVEREWRVGAALGHVLVDDRFVL